MNEKTLVIPARTMRVAVAVSVALLVVAAFGVVPGPRQALATALAPRLTADRAALEVQRLATEHSVQRGYAKAVDQLRQVRELTLAIAEREAVAVDAKAREDLRSIRREALAAVGQLTGLGGPSLDAYVGTTETRLDVGSVKDEPGALLAPQLFSVVRRADELFQQRADSATRELTRAPTTPSPSARPSPSPTGR